MHRKTLPVPKACLPRPNNHHIKMTARGVPDISVRGQSPARGPTRASYGSGLAGRNNNDRTAAKASRVIAHALGFQSHNKSKTTHIPPAAPRFSAPCRAGPDCGTRGHSGQHAPKRGTINPSMDLRKIKYPNPTVANDQSCAICGTSHTRQNTRPRRLP